jgi:hypothetical protein
MICHSERLRIHQVVDFAVDAAVDFLAKTNLSRFSKFPAINRGPSQPCVSPQSQVSEWRIV